MCTAAGVMAVAQACPILFMPLVTFWPGSSITMAFFTASFSVLGVGGSFTNWRVVIDRPR
ncbi:hypothetical protein PF007_g31507 [Phytophthora fragariae]|uniref:Uncharacterized protein n=1 Tax=Phytophthora fragariae TaxID=53985 RepID=A0A6A3D8A1_9STRA|nr:hypothetical protein PF009_g33131 [Phytophthora fragariae]KAE9057848.1 hypothetical protein PF007_g31507 [Phytophthora fragariae]